MIHGEAPRLEIENKFIIIKKKYKADRKKVTVYNTPLVPKLEVIIPNGLKCHFEG